MSDVVTQAMCLSMAALCHRLNEDGWDQNPSLWLACRELGESDDALSFRIEPVAGEDAFGSLGTSPSDTLALLAWHAEKTGALNEAPSDAFAFVFVSEAYMSTNVEEPERKEVRIIGAVDRAGFRYSYIFFRETGEELMEAGRPGEGDTHLSGRVMESLTRLIDACPTTTDWG